jgi:Zn-dependent protease
MDTLLVFIYIIGAILVLFLFRYILVAQNILGAALKKASVQLIRQSDCPLHLQELYALKEGELQDLGFHFSHCLLVDGLYVKKDTKRYFYVYYNPVEKTYAHLMACPEADRYIPFWVSFYTYFENGKKLVTVNGIRHTIMDTMPDSILQDGYVETLEKQWTLHLDYLSQHNDLEIKEFGEAQQDFEEIVELEQKSLNDYLAELERKGRIFKTGDDRYLFKTIPALLFASRMIRGTAKANVMKRMKMENEVPVDVPVQLEVENYANAQSLLNPEKRNTAGKIVFLLATVVMFVLAIGFLISFEVAFLLMGIIFIHEGGHLLAMALFGYKDLRMLFIPLFGAVAMGSARGVKPYKRVITFFAGPVPGIVLAFLLWTLIQNESIPLIYTGTLAMTFLLLLFVNYFNLIPVMPLDGGQILDIIIFSRFTFLQFLFFIISVLALAAMAIFLKAPLLLIIALIIPFGYRNHFIRRRLNVQVQDQLKHRVKADLSYTDVITEVFKVLHDPPYENFPFQKKIQIVRYVENNFNAPKASMGTVIFTLLFYALIFVLPVVYFLPVVSTGSLFSQKGPCAIVERMKAPKDAAVEMSRFERVDKSLGEGASLICYRYCFYSPSGSTNPDEYDHKMFSVELAGDFLSRLWALYGEPDLMENSFVYTLRDKKTGFIFTAYCFSFFPAFGSNEREKSKLILSLYLFNKLLEETEPVDCHVEIAIDFSKFPDNVIDEEEYRKHPEIYKATFKIGSKDGIPFTLIHQPN